MVTGDNNNQDNWHSGECWDPTHTIAIRWTVPTRYQDLTFISQGKFGAVMKATDTRTNKKVAIKKLLRPFFSGTHGKRTYRELRLLQHVNHPNAHVVQLYNVFTPERTLDEFESIYLVFNYVPFVIPTVITRNIPFPENHVKHIIYSLLRGLKFLHSANIIHRDLTPRNVGIDENSEVTILDLGLARVASNGIQTGYVVARWWRAPEVIVSWERYDKKLDIWSVGCIMAELLRLTPLFPGTDYMDQLRRILQVIGTPTEQELNDVCQEEARLFILNEMPNIPPADFHVLFPTLSEEGISFLKLLLQFDPEKRPTAEEALHHPYMAVHHEEEFEPTLEPIPSLHDDGQYSIQQWKQLTWGLIQNFHEPEWALQPPAN